MHSCVHSAIQHVSYPRVRYTVLTSSLSQVLFWIQILHLCCALHTIMCPHNHVPTQSCAHTIMCPHQLSSCDWACIDVAHVNALQNRKHQFSVPFVVMSRLDEKTVYHWPTSAHNLSFCINYLITTWLIRRCVPFSASVHQHELVAARSDVSSPASHHDSQETGS